MYALLIIALLWIVLRTISLLTRYFGTMYTNALSKDDIAHQRSIITAISVIRHVIVFIVLVAGIGIALSGFRMFQTLGISLLASAGVVSVAVAVAARPVLGNIVAGVQLAATKPVRIGDTVMFEQNWAKVEEIGHTYVTLLTWDERRVIVPLRYLIDHTIENWSKTDSHMIKPIFLYLDYAADVPKIRSKFEELVHASEYWDGKKEPLVKVTAVSEETMTLRLVASGGSPSDAWELHCTILEEMISFVRDLDGGKYLPRRRLLMQSDEVVASPKSNGTPTSKDRAQSYSIN